MKGIFISCNQALYDEVVATFDTLGIRGFSAWEETLGRGTKEGEPHYGTHAWATMNSSLLAFVDDDAMAERLMASLAKLDAESGAQGLRAFTFPAERTL